MLAGSGICLARSDYSGKDAYRLFSTLGRVGCTDSVNFQRVLKINLTLGPSADFPINRPEFPGDHNE